MIKSLINLQKNGRRPNFLNRFGQKSAVYITNRRAINDSLSLTARRGVFRMKTLYIQMIQTSRKPVITAVRVKGMPNFMKVDDFTS